MIKFSLFSSILILLFTIAKTNAQENYLKYHSKVIECEELIAQGKFTAAINGFDSLFNQYGFLFRRETKVATELSTYQKDYALAFKFIRLGIKAGWTLKHINKSKNLQPLMELPFWSEIESSYDSLHQIYLSRLNTPVKKRVHEMFKNDQKKALGALLRIGQKSKRRYSEKKFAPHSEYQLEQMEQILNEYGYPSERLIGNDLWGSVILSHHNSISVNYNSKDSLYAQLKPQLLTALKQGKISPYELAQIEDWRTAALNDHELTSYGFLGAIQDHKELKTVNNNRSRIGIRSIELRNKLIDIEKSTGMNLYLPKGWQNGKIAVVNE